MSQAAGAGAGKDMNDEERARYDRQIRLWGEDAQKNMLESRICVVNMRGLAVEIAKNITLAGVGEMAIVDGGEVTELDLCANFFLTEEHLGQKRAEAVQQGVQELNPHVKVTTDVSDPRGKTADFWGRFSVVCAIDCPLEVQKGISRMCRERGVGFLGGNQFGPLSGFFVDWGESFQCREETPVVGENKSTVVNKEYHFAPLDRVYEDKAWAGTSPGPEFLLYQALLSLHGSEGWVVDPEKGFSVAELSDAVGPIYGRMGVLKNEKLGEGDLALAPRLIGDYSPVCSVVGAEASQEVLKYIQRKTPGPLINNFFLFNSLGLNRGLNLTVPKPRPPKRERPADEEDDEVL